MFATVEFYESRGRGFGAMRNLFIRPKIISERISVEENEYFYKLKVPVKKGKVPYEKLKRLSSSVTDGLIFPEGFTAEGEIKTYKSNYFEDILLFNTALEEISKSVFEPLKTVITLIDKKGVLSSSVSRLVPYAGEIRVITEKERAYRAAVKKIMEEYGLSLFVTQKLSCIPKNGIIISRESSSVPLSFKGVVITRERRHLPFAEVLTGEGIICGEKYEKLCPTGIDRMIFLSALCEVCFVKDLRTARHEKLVDIS